MLKNYHFFQPYKVEWSLLDPSHKTLTEVLIVRKTSWKKNRSSTRVFEGLVLRCFKNPAWGIDLESELLNSRCSLRLLPG